MTITLDQDPPPEDPLHCLACGHPKRAKDYLCPGCWATLQPRTRTRLRKAGDLSAAARRLASMRAQIRDGVPLNQITVGA